METNPKDPAFTDKTATRIRSLLHIAEIHESLLPTEDAARLTGIDLLTEKSNERFWKLPEAGPDYSTRHGFVVGKDPEPAQEKALANALLKRARAAQYVQWARRFVGVTRGKDIRLFAISGSTSYQSVSQNDDLDFFCITRRDSLWIFLSRALLLARFSKLLDKQSPRICFSYAVDDDYALGEFIQDKDALFARDALTTIALHGSDYYNDLLSHAGWMSKYFPKAYEQRASINSARSVKLIGPIPSTRTRFLNRALFLLVGNYISLKSRLLNRKFAAEGKHSSVFAARIGQDHCVFESGRYSKLRTTYRDLDTNHNESEKSGQSDSR